MTRLVLAGLVPAVIVGLFGFSLPLPAAELNAIEKIYADLAKLAPDERARRIEDGAVRDGEVNMSRGLGNKEGIAQLQLFQKRYPKVKLKYVIRSSAEAAEVFLQEETAGRHLTDVVGIQSPDLGEIMSRGLAASYPTPAIKAVLPVYKGFLDPTGRNRWGPWYATTHGIGYNPRLLKPEDAPKSWPDLCNPRYKGENSFEPAETRMLLGLYFIFDQSLEKVRSFLECLGKNEPILMKGHTTRALLLMAGDHALSADLLIYRGIFENRKNPKKAPFEVAYEAPVFMDAESLVINRNSPRPYASALFVDWNFSAESQDHMVANFREALAAKHPFFPDNAQIVPTMFLGQDIVDKLHGYWKQYVGGG